MGKGGKKKGKLAFTLIGMVTGFYGAGLGWFGTATALQGTLMGASLASTLWSVTQKPDKYGNLDSDYSQDDYSRFSQVTNDINQNAVIPVIYGTRKYGGLQTYHNPYNGNRYLQKDVVTCFAGIEGIFDVKANEELIKDDTNISIYNIQYQDATVTRTSGSNLRLHANGKDKDYTLGHTNDYNAQTSLLATVIDKIKAEAGDGWKIDGAVDDRTSKGISANSMQFNNSKSVPCYCPPDDSNRANAVVLDNRGYKIGTYTLHQNESPDNYKDTGGYPHMAWIRSELVASARLSGSNPTINATIKGMKVKVWNGNQWVVEYSENPAWIIRDFLTNKIYGVGQWISEDMLDDESFKSVASYCDEEVEYLDFDGKIKRVPRYRLNIVLDSAKTPIDHLSSMLAVFGGFITFGHLISLKVEKAETPVYAFDDDIIVKDSMSIGQTSFDDTPNRYKIGYFEPSQYWTEVKVIVEDLELQHEQNDKIYEKTVTLAGCTSQNQALRIGRLYRDLNKVCALTISFSVATQGMMLECGDVITVTYGGIFEKMPFRITQIEETNAGTYQLTCRQYNASIYNDELGSQITNPNYVVGNSPYQDTPPTVTGLTAKENTSTSDEGILNIGVDLQWDDTYYQFFDHYQISISTDGYTYRTSSNSYENEAYLNGLQTGKYWISVQIVTKDGIKGNPAITTITILGKDAPPPDVKVLDNDLLPSGIRRFWWDYEYPKPNDIAGFKLKYVQGNNIDWDNAFDLHTGVITAQPFETQALRQGIHTVLIKAIDNAGNESVNPASAVLNLGELLEENVLWKENLADTKWSKVSHNGVVGTDGKLRGKKVDEPLVINLRFQPLSAGQMWLSHDITSKAKIEYCVGSGSLAWGKNGGMFMWLKPTHTQWKFNALYKPYTGRVMVNATDSFHAIIEITPDKGKVAEIGKLMAYIDVPDSKEVFDNLRIPASGLTLPIKTPYYYTTAVRCDGVSTDVSGQIEMEIVSRTPCVIRFNKINNDAGFTKTPIDVYADITWQGFERNVV